MSLRTRLTLVLTLAVALPVLAAAVVLGVVLPRHFDAAVRADARGDALDGAPVVAEACGRLQAVSEVLGQQALSSSPARAVRAVRASHRVQWAAILDAGGRVVAAAGTPPASAAAAPSCGSAPATGPALVGRTVLLGPPARTAVVAVPAGAVAADLGHARGARVRLEANGRTVAASGPSLGGPLVESVVPAAPGRPFAVVVALPASSYAVLRLTLALGALAVLALAALLARGLAYVATRPLTVLAGAAQRVAAGDLAAKVPVEGHDEVGRVGEAFNAMIGSVRRHLDDVACGRDELRRSVQRLGETLSSTHDLSRMLGVVLDTAMATTGARAGAIHLREGAELTCRVERGEVGGTTASMLVVPLDARDRRIGLLELYDRADGCGFDADDVAAVRGLAAHAVVAIENVVLHNEAQRLSVTDGLTGVWNRRYLMLALRSEVERAHRHHHPLAVLIVDVDRFKRLNDTYGHLRGDAVLAEVAHRLRAEVRETDVLARYGGEEFVLVLPETDGAGAVRACERLCAAVRDRLFLAEDDAPLAVTVSIGAALLGEATPTADALLRAADDALYLAKNSGRDGYRVAPRLPLRQIRLDAPTTAPPPR